MITIGLIINPIAGIGGKVGLKGSDGIDTQKRALEMGAVPESTKKAKTALSELKDTKDIVFLTCPGKMGENALCELDLPYTVLEGENKETTMPEDTVKYARMMSEKGVSCILFAGGDGTARNILDANVSVPVIGIPAGCKIHSAVYAVNPRRAGKLVCDFANGKKSVLKKTAEVMDIDEDLFRQGIVEAKLYGYIDILTEKDMTQNLKSGKGLSEEASTYMIAQYITDEMKKDTLYIIGSGSTTKAIKNKLEIDGTLLGVDLVYNKKLICKDACEKDILSCLEKYPEAKIIITVIGGQGFIFGRGNQQLSADVLKKTGKENIMIAATKQKMISLLGRTLLIDTGNEDVNKYLEGYYRITTGIDDFVIFPAKS